MSRINVTIAVLIFLIALLVGAVYFKLIPIKSFSRGTQKSVSLVSSVIPWEDLRQEILSNCKTIPPFENVWNRNDYETNIKYAADSLIKSGGIPFSGPSFNLVPIINSETFPMEETPQSSCWGLVVSDASGLQAIIYEKPDSSFAISGTQGYQPQ